MEIILVEYEIKCLKKTINCGIKIYIVEYKYKLLNINMQVVEFCNIWLTIPKWGAACG